ncbi:hypothetical protein [Bacillus massiliglaciei]|uniref:hypothetical protein n=1 Tax=Bacillus massiliglaciei TaxID=1816693 RepID=UPI000DA62989|nr:hypothetical protein [Bacillus massiliglaciei]
MENLPDFFHYHFTEEKRSLQSIDFHFRPMPAANPDLLIQAAKSAQVLLDDIRKVINTFASSKDFSKRVMEAAQDSKKDTVTNMLRKTGIKTVPDVSFTPDGLRMDFRAQAKDNVRMIISLKWNEF